MPPGFSLPDCLSTLTLHHFQQIKAERIFAVLIPIVLQGFAAMALVSQVAQMGGKAADLPLLMRFAPSHNGHTDVEAIVLSTVDGINQPQIGSVLKVVNPALKEDHVVRVHSAVVPEFDIRYNCGSKLRLAPRNPEGTGSLANLRILLR